MVGKGAIEEPCDSEGYEIDAEEKASGVLRDLKSVSNDWQPGRKHVRGHFSDRNESANKQRKKSKGHGLKRPRF
jgi:hypothetical protein